MNVSDALKTRKSCRKFLPDAVPSETVKAILNTALRSPSGGNLQPWHIWVLEGDAVTRLGDEIDRQLPTSPGGEEMEYTVFPTDLNEAAQGRLFQAGASLYGALGIERDDEAGRYNQLRENFRFYGAPVGMFFGIDKNMGPPQWSDLGMLIQSVMLVAREHGLHTCAQEAWAMWPKTLRRFLDTPDDMLIFCGLGLGHMDEDAPGNSFTSTREPLDQTVSFVS